MADKQVKVILTATTGPYTKGMNEASAATRKLGGDIDKTGESSKGFASKTGAASAALKGMVAAGAALAGTALVAFLRDSVRAAGDLEQSIGGVDSVFGDTAATVHEFGKTSAESVGLSRNAFNELITVTGALLKNKGLEDFTQKSLDLVKVGADLAATFGGTTAQAVEALNAAMRGESDPIERYGISLNMAAVNAELAAKGLTGLKGAALEQAQAQARLDIIARQSADALGQFGREANTLQGQQQRLNAEWEDAKAALGTALLPAMTTAVSLMREGLDAALALAAGFDNVPTPVLAAAAALAAVHLAGPKVAAAAASIRVTMSAAGEAMHYASLAATRAGGGFAGAAAGLRTFTGSAGLAASAAAGLRSAASGALGMLGGPWGLAFMGAAALVTKFWQEQQAAKQHVEDLTNSLDDQTGAITKNTTELVTQALIQSGAIELAKQLGADLDDVTAAALGEEEALARLTGQLEENTTAAQKYSGVMGEEDTRRRELVDAITGQSDALGEATDAAKLEREVQASLQKSLDDTGDAAHGAAAGQSELAEETKSAADAAEEARKELDKYIDSLTAAGMLTLDTRAATRSYREALDDAREAAKEATKAGLTQKQMFDENTKAGRKNAEALDKQARRAEALAQAIYEQTGSEAKFRESLKKSRDELIATYKQFDNNQSRAEAYADSILAIPSSKRTHVTLDKESASAAVYSIQREIDGIRGKSVNVNVVYKQIGNPSGTWSTRGGVSRASGGPVFGPGTSTSDSIPAWLSNGEFVMKAAAVDKYGMSMMRDINALRLASGGPAMRPGTRASTLTASGNDGPSLVGLRISGQLGLDGRLEGVIDAVDDFARNAPVRSRMARGVR